MNPPEQKPAEPTNSSTQQTTPKKQWQPKQWQPLGTIRDSFAELLKQDATWERYRP